MTAILCIGYSFFSSIITDALTGEIKERRNEYENSIQESFVLHDEYQEFVDANNFSNMQESMDERPMLSAMKTLASQNEDTVGWIRVSGTDVDNVIVQGDDNNHYLHYDFFNAPNEAGTIFLDERCQINPSIKSNNIILYGHNQRDGSMFGTLTSYKLDPLKVNEYPYIEFNNMYDNFKFKIVSMFIINTKEEHDNEPLFYYNMYTKFDDYYTYEEFSSQIQKRSMVKSNIDIKETDTFITLSTCAADFDDARFVIVGRAIRDKNDLEIKEEYTINESAYFPRIYNG